MVFQKVEKYDLNIVDQLSTTIRGEGGFGHTGIK
jgi:dUTPase